MTCSICSHDKQRDDGACAGCGYLVLRVGIRSPREMTAAIDVDGYLVLDDDDNEHQSSMAPHDALRLARYILARLGGEEGSDV